ncbi:putative addiction module antidote protein [Pasteurellaceae bacterium 15-036681]|nr:putative addiction module antidote protein [Pasteurellaceae bacterium 15-036681]
MNNFNLSEDDLMVSEFDELEHLKDDDVAFHYLNFALESGNYEEIILALGNIAKAKGIGMSELSRQTGLGRGSLYKTLSGKADIKLTTFLKILNVFNLQLNSSKVAMS